MKNPVMRATNIKPEIIIRVFFSLTGTYRGKKRIMNTFFVSRGETTVSYLGRTSEVLNLHLNVPNPAMHLLWRVCL